MSAIMKRLGAAALVVLLGAGTALAASESEINAIIKSLAPIKGQTISPGYGGGQAEEVLVDRDRITVDYAYSVEIEVYFPFDSARLTPRAKDQLEALGRALESQTLVPYRYLVAGHTDAKGSAAYNEDLSWRRARSVASYLIENFAIEPRRLRTKGWGESRLKDPGHPNAGINRRVEIVLMRPMAMEPMTPEPQGHTTTIVVPGGAGDVTVTVEPRGETPAGMAGDRPAAPPVEPATDPATGLKVRPDGSVKIPW